MNEKTITGEIKAINNFIRRRMESHRIGCPHGYILYYLSHCETEVYQRDVEKFFSIRPATATQALNQLEREGYINRAASQADGRLKRIILTQKGKDMDAKAKEEIGKTEAIIRKNLSEEEIKRFFELTAKIIDGFSEK